MPRDVPDVPAQRVADSCNGRASERIVAGPFPFHFASVKGCLVAATLAAIIAVVAVRRRPAVPRLTRGATAAGLLALTLAAGGLVWHRPAVSRQVAVHVDLSASTRTAAYRDRAALERRIRELLGNTPYRVIYFAGEVGTVPDAASALPDLPGERTAYAPPEAPTVLLFSDGRFELPAYAPPTYAVIDPGLENVTDAGVEGLEAEGPTLSVAVRNTGPERVLVFDGITKGAPQGAVPSGAYVLTRPIDRSAATASAQLSPGDAWPENDALSVPTPPANARERWWVSSTGAAPGEGWTVLQPSQLPTAPAAYLAPSVIVVDNTPAAALGDVRQQRLRQYVRDLGGGLVLLGGGRAFGAGGYAGTPVESISPLASTPPQATTHWVLLADASGSMSTTGAGGKSRWRYAAEAVAGVLPRLPPADVVSAGSFAEGLTWWVRGAGAREAAAQPLPPAGVAPRGPTNLRPALEQVAAAAEAGLPTQLLVVTDANADLGDVETLSAALKAKNVRFHLLDIGGGTGAGLPALRQLASATGGSVREEAAPERWAEGVRELMRGAMPDLLVRESIPTRFTGELSGLPPRAVELWNRTWLKPGASLLAEGENAQGSERVPMAAFWPAGEGRVAAAAFAASPSDVEALARLVERPPRDPRLSVRWETGPKLSVTLDASDERGYVNGLRPTLELSSPGDAEGGRQPVSRPVPQTAPGRYTLAIDAPRRPAFAAVRLDGRVIDRVAVAGRYAPEFEAVGNNRENLRALAARSGGAVVEPSRMRPLDLPWPRRDVPLAPPLALAGAFLIALGLVRWRIGS